MRDLIGHDRRPSAYLAYLAILSVGGGRPVTVSHQQLAERIGLSKRAVQDAVAHLQQRGLLRITRRGRTEPALVEPLTPWRWEAKPPS
ncbi:MarR family transcriptional regulator [Sphingomonas nostoxanthinifaciens]|uniref:MarR family transcriptional regulator n=1 Tax=Sphingomonas nostoxanthinifaciens TaxID=2872652 RepID=UPI0037DA3572